MTDRGKRGDPGDGGSRFGQPRSSIVVPRPRGPKDAEPEEAAAYLLRALRAKTPEEREHLANQGLTRSDASDAETRALLLRQLYLAYLEYADFDAALEVAEEMIDLETLGDIARQDAARAAAGLGEIDAAAAHLEIAAKVCPPDRRAFHHGTLGALLRFAGRSREAVAAFEHAVATATVDGELYRAQLGLAEVDAGLTPRFPLATLLSELESAEPRKGYALWVLGELSGLLGDVESSRDYLLRFVERMTDAPRAKALALAGEVAHVEALLGRISA